MIMMIIIMREHRDFCIILNQCVIITGELKVLATNSRLMLDHYYRADRLIPDFHVSKTHITAVSNQCQYF